MNYSGERCVPACYKVALIHCCVRPNSKMAFMTLDINDE